MRGVERGGGGGGGGGADGEVMKPGLHSCRSC